MRCTGGPETSRGVGRVRIVQWKFLKGGPSRNAEASRTRRRSWPLYQRLQGVQARIQALLVAAREDTRRWPPPPSPAHWHGNQLTVTDEMRYYLLSKGL